MAQMTVGQVKDYVASLVDDLNFGYFTSAELLRYINQCQLEVQKRLIQAGQNWYVKIDETTPTVINQANYALPSDFLKMNRLELVNNPGVSETRYALKSVTLNQKDLGYNDNDSICFYILKSTLYLTPLPKTVRTIRMYYTYRIADVTGDSDTPDIPEQYGEYLANLVAMRCFLKDGRDPGFILKTIQEVEMALDADAIERAQDHASTVVIADEGDLGY